MLPAPQYMLGVFVAGGVGAHRRAGPAIQFGAQLVADPLGQHVVVGVVVLSAGVCF